jgi:hypothetical protein
MDELRGAGMASGDSNDSAPDATSETDSHLRPVDDSGHETWAEDAEPLTRGEYADQMRQGPAIEETGAASDANRDQDDARPQATAEDQRAQEELPEPRTRQEVADEADRVQPSSPDRGQAVDLDTRIADEDKLPEPRTRQEVGDETRSSAEPLTEGNADVRPELAPEQTTHQSELDHLRTGSQSEIGDTYSPFTVVKVEAADRTFDDTAPTGIGLKPTGEQLLKIENEEISKPEKLRRKLLEGIDDINDAARDNASLGHDLLTRHQQPSGHAMTEVPHPLPDGSHEGGAAPDITSAGLVAGILLVEATRLSRGPIHRIAEAAKGHMPWR